MNRVKMLRAVKTIPRFPPSIVLIRKDMDVNEYKRLFNNTCRLFNNTCRLFNNACRLFNNACRLFNNTCRHNSTFIAALHFSHSRVFNHEQNPYPKISVKRPLAILYTFIDTRFIWASLSSWCYLYLGVSCYQIVLSAQDVFYRALPKLSVLTLYPISVNA